jgi:hypothetical protein
MSLLNVAQDVCEVVGVERPATVFGDIVNQRTQQELLALANEMAATIAYDTRDWVDLMATATFTGDGVTERFALPGDYLRMLVDANVWVSTTPLMPLRFIGSYDEWLWRSAANYWDSRGSYILFGGGMMIQPILPAGGTARFGYISRNMINLAGGGRSDTFVSDDDTFLLAERLLKLGMIWRWKSNKGSPYAEDMGTFSDALAMKLGRDQPAPILIGSAPMSTFLKTSTAYPWTLPTT